jgi:hypothetical protein
MSYSISLEAVIQRAAQEYPGGVSLTASHYNLYPIIISDQSELVINGNVEQFGDITVTAGELSTSYFEDSSYPIDDIIGVQETNGSGIVQVGIPPSSTT